MGWRTGVQFLVGAMMGFFSLCHHVQTESGVHPTSYPIGTEGWGVNLTTHLHIVLRLGMNCSMQGQGFLDQLRGTLSL